MKDDKAYSSTTISGVRIQGLWGELDFNLDLDPDINFLIGVNGTGKTTVMNLVGAALTRDYETLAEVLFTEVEITLRAGRIRPKIRVVRDSDPERPGAEITYYVSDTAAGPVTKFDVGRFVVRTGREGRQQRFYYEQDGALQKKLDQLIRVVWLTVHRARTATALEYEDPFNRRRVPTPLIDVKLDQVSQRLARYFSILDSQRAAEAESYRRTALLGLIKSDWTESPFWRRRRSPNPSQQKQTLTLAARMFEDMGVEESAYGPALRRMFKSHDSAVANLNGPITVEMLSTLLQMERLDELIREWKSSEAKRKEIFSKRDRFLEILNSLYRNKRLHIAETNEISVLTDSGTDLPLLNLSSGEKQLLILFGEALLQGEDSWVYLADEPELSLHVEWQARLVSGIRDLSPGVQVFFATHSPDVVGRFGFGVQDMEYLIR